MVAHIRQQQFTTTPWGFEDGATMDTMAQRCALASLHREVEALDVGGEKKKVVAAAMFSNLEHSKNN